jgi:predicted porin
MKSTFKYAALALATGLALGAQSASAQSTSSVTVYGKLYPQIQSARISGSSAPGSVSSLNAANAAAVGSNTFTGLASSNSRIGLRGVEDLGGGLTAIFNLEGRVKLTNGAMGSGSGATAAPWNRAAWVGLQSKTWGTVKMGHMDTIYKEYGDNWAMGVASGNFPASTYLLSFLPFGGVQGSSANFHITQNNSIRYESPSFGGLQVMGQWADGDSTTSNNSWLADLAVVYNANDIYGALVWERHHNYLPSSTDTGLGTIGNNNDDGFRLTLGYNFTANTRAQANIVYLNMKEPGYSYKRWAWSANVRHIMAPWTFQLEYTQALAGSCTAPGGGCSTSGMGAQQFDLGVFYGLSKRTELFFIASYLNNGRSSNYNNMGVDVQPMGVRPGQDVTNLALGLHHRF